MQEASVAVLACSQCGRAVAQSELVQLAGSWVCAECKPAFLNRLMASGVAGATARARYGGFWIRFGARFIDGLILMVPMMIIFFMAIFPKIVASRGVPPNPANPLGVFMATGIFTFIIGSIVVTVIYEASMLKSKGVTLGKMACGLKVIRSDGRSLGWGTSIGRVLMWHVVTSGIPYVNWVLILVSVIMLGSDSEKRSLHDRVCDTRVVYK